MKKIKRIGFLTCPDYKKTLKKLPSFVDEFELLRPVFKRMGAELVAVDWRAVDLGRNAPDILVPKAVWDYFHHPKEFQSFLEKVLGSRVAMQNPAAVVQWNMRKTYLLDLQAKGLPVAPLRIFPKGSVLNVAQWERSFPNADHLIAKPSISGGARDTTRFERSRIKNQVDLFRKILSYSDLIIQPFCEEIALDGEYSFFFFKDDFSHAILKKPPSGEYRAHQLYGAVTSRYEPLAAEIRQAFEYVAAVGKPLAYARVDVFKRSGVFNLIELELVEPYLYFETAPQEAVEKFCSAVLSN